MALLEASVELLEARTGTTFTDYPAGRNDSDPSFSEKSGPAQEDMTTTEGKAQARVRDMVKLMRLTLDPVNTRTRPLLIYAIKAWAETRLQRTVYREQLGFELVSSWSAMREGRNDTYKFPRTVSAGRYGVGHLA